MNRLTPFLAITMLALGCKLFGGHWDVDRECVEVPLPGFFSATCERTVTYIGYIDPGVFLGRRTGYRIPFPLSRNVVASYVYADAVGLELLTASALIDGRKQDPVVMGSGDDRELLAICSDPYNNSHGNPDCAEGDLAQLLRVMSEAY